MKKSSFDSNYPESSNAFSYQSNSNANTYKRLSKSARINKSSGWGKTVEDLMRYLKGLLGDSSVSAKKYPNAEMFDSRLADSWYRSSGENTVGLGRQTSQQKINPNEKFIADLQRDLAVAARKAEIAADRAAKRRSAAIEYKSKRAEYENNKDAYQQFFNTFTTQPASSRKPDYIQPNMFDPETEFSGTVPSGFKEPKSSTSKTPFKPAFIIPQYTGPVAVDRKALRQPYNVMVNGIPSAHPFLTNADFDAGTNWLIGNPSNKRKNFNSLIREKVSTDALQGNGFNLPPGLKRSNIKEIREGLYNNFKTEKRMKSSRVTKRANGPDKNKYF